MLNGRKLVSYLKFGCIKYIRRAVVFVNKIRLKKEAVWKEIENFKTQVKPYNQFTKKYQDYSKYLIVYKTIKKFKPKFVLECGSGITTAIINAALKENGFGKLISMDELAQFGDVVARIVGPSVEMRISPSVEEEFEGMRGTRYQEIPDYPYDLIFVDGPYTKTIDLDAFYLLKKNPRIKVLIDCRVATVRALKQKYGGRFNPFVNLGFINF